MLVLIAYFVGLIQLLLYGIQSALIVVLKIIHRPVAPESYGTWSIVTGATDGIGKQTALQLVKRGQHVLLISRCPDKLSRTKSELTQYARKTEVQTLAIDFSQSDLTEQMEAFKHVIKDKDVGLLVNNAGLSYDHAMYFHEVPTKLIDDLININLRVPTMLARIVVEAMETKRRGAIVFVGSASGVLPSDPLYAVYAATKAGVDALARSLQVEYRSSGILVQCQTPCYVQTKMAKIKQSSFMAPSPASYADALLGSVGRASVYDFATVSAYLPHTVLLFILQRVPEVVFGWFRLKQTKDLRRRWMIKNHK